MKAESDTANEPQHKNGWKTSMRWIRSLSGLAYRLYQHITGVFAAFTIAAFLSHFISFDWQSVLADLLDIWNTAIRPVTTALLNATLVPAWVWIFGWPPHLPLVVKDYIAAGCVVALSDVRAIGFEDAVAKWRRDLPLKMVSDTMSESILWGTVLTTSMVVTFVLTSVLLAIIWVAIIALWPLLIALRAAVALDRTAEFRRLASINKRLWRLLPSRIRPTEEEQQLFVRAQGPREGTRSVMSLAPVFWLTILLIANLLFRLFAK